MKKRGYYLAFTLAEVLIAKRESGKMSSLSLSRTSELKAPSNKLIKRCAFTLAEVLITLGIIGVVAALVLPNAVKNWQEFSYKQAAKEAYSKTAQAVQLMSRDNDGDISSFVETATTFKPEFMKYFKVLDKCSTLCVPASHSSDLYKTLKGLNGDTYYMDDGQFVTMDGMFFGVENPGSAHSAYSGYAGVAVDINGYNKPPNAFGKDVYAFAVFPNGKMMPMGATGLFLPGTTVESSAYCDKNGTSAMQGWGCMAKVMRGEDY